MKKVELLAPAGNMEKFKMALHYGADAVFMGGKMFNLRAGSNNFSDEELEEAVAYAHERGKRVYITLNIIPHNDELEALPEYVKFLEKVGVDGVIVADLGVFQVVKENSNLNISISTQASNTNWRSVKMWKDMGAKRVVLAREISLENIKEIREKVPDIELEVFVHGAMCMAVSGRCLLSNYFTSRDANRGICAQDCRWNYKVIAEGHEEKGAHDIVEEQGETFIFNAKDLCTIDFIDKVIETGVDSLKIEGRMKSLYYTALVTRAYRKRIDALFGKISPAEAEPFVKELYNTAHRAFGTGFYFSKDDANKTTRGESKSPYNMAGTIGKELGNNRYEFISMNKITADMPLEYIGPDICAIEDRNYTLHDPETGAARDWVCHGHPCLIRTEAPLRSGFIVRTRIGGAL